ncbi:MAG: SagB/ThcOx family dehydrogenase, partial [Thermodesulfobacteriota bacterium]|nr:SagB/ThcOx family dehydrogenase [Thermodesulfobacteriota bacterium]
MTLKSFKEYHRLTSFEPGSLGGRGMDWAAQPSVFKHYPGVEYVPLDRDVDLPKIRLSEVLQKGADSGRDGTGGGQGGSRMDIRSLSRILLLAHTLTAKSGRMGSEYYYRSAASAGALYPTELYVALRGVTGLSDGVYHYNIAEHTLARLRQGDFTAFASRAMGIEGGSFSLSFFITGIFFRSAWKYGDRAFRYVLLDSGHVLENLALALASEGLLFTVNYDFDDANLNTLLGVEPSREGCLAGISVGPRTSVQGEVQAPQALPETLVRASRVSPYESEFPEIVSAYQETGARQKKGPSKGLEFEDLGVLPGPWMHIPEASPDQEIMDYAGAVFSRRSRRSFGCAPISRAKFKALLHMLFPVISQAPPHVSGQARNAMRTGFLVRCVQGLEPGFYALDREERAVSLVREGAFLDAMANVCLGQGWLAGAGAHFLFLTDFKALDKCFGPRGYRLALLEAGRMGQRVYLAITALGLSCCGVGAFFDF